MHHKGLIIIQYNTDLVFNSKCMHRYTMIFLRLHDNYYMYTDESVRILRLPLQENFVAQFDESR